MLISSSATAFKWKITQYHLGRSSDAVVVNIIFAFFDNLQIITVDQFITILHLRHHHGPRLISIAVQ